MRSMLSISRRPLRLIRSVLGDPAGSTAVIIALALSAIVGFAGLGTETASWYFIKRSMQGAADSAAATAAAELAASSSTTSTQMTSAARSIASRFGFADGTGSTTVTVNNPPASGGYDSTYVEVIISQPQPALLSAVFLSSGPTITSRAVAHANKQATDDGCVVALSQQSGSIDISASGGVALTFNSCALYDNSAASNALTMSNNATISAAAAYVVGGISGGSGLTTTDGTYTGVNPLTDPYLSRSIPSYGPVNLQSGNGCDYKNKLHITSSNGPMTLKPATANGKVIFCNDVVVDAGQTLNLCPGIYILDTGSLTMAGNSVLNAPPSVANISLLCVGDLTGGVTIIFDNSSGGSPGVANISSSGATLNVTAPTTGSTAGLAFFQARLTCTGTGNNSNGCTSTFTGASSLNVTGVIYFPDNSVSWSGGGSAGGTQCTKLVAYTITFSGASSFNSSCVGTGSGSINYTNGTLVL
jgi:Putative Flp pilus-assembly TadE/G-like